MSLPFVAETFGDLLKYLRRKARLTQRELAVAVGYTEAHICRLEKNERLPDITTVAALFIPALYLEDEPEWMQRLLKLAAEARDKNRPPSAPANRTPTEHPIEQDANTLENIPAILPHYVVRPSMVLRVRTVLERERCVLLCGLPGMGKTTLATAIAHEFERGPVFWMTLNAGLNTSVEAMIRQLALFLLANGQGKVKPLIEDRTEGKPIPLDQQLMLIRAALAQQPTMLCFEDVHLLTGNEDSLSLLRYLISTTGASLLLTSRQDVPLPVMQINVGGLETEEAQVLIERLGVSLETNITNSLFVRTGCSPMLLRLATGQLLDTPNDAQTFIEHLETQPQVTSYLVSTVLQDLSPATRWLAELISVFRKPLDLFDERLIELIGKADLPCCLEEAFSELQHYHLIDDMRSARLHPLVRDHLYALLATDPPLKKQLHRLAAEWSEQAQGDVVDAAYHWLHAGDLEQAIEMISDQSELLFNQGQAQAAVQVVEEALERIKGWQSKTGNLRQQLLTARGDLLRGTIRAAEAEASYREALALAHHMPAVRARIIRSLAQILMQRGQTAEALELCQSAAAGLVPADSVLLARLASIECRAHLVLSHYDEAERTANYAISLSKQFAEILPQLADDVRARAERTLGWICYTRHPQGTESLVHYRRALECARKAGLRSIENAILSNTATALMERGDLDKALQTYREALKGNEALGDLYGVAGVRHNLGVLHNIRHESEAALAQFEKASEIERLIGDLEGLLSTEEARAAVLLTMGKLDEACHVVNGILAEDRGSSDAWTLGSCLCLLIEIQLLSGELDDARSTARRILSMPGIEDNARIRAWAMSNLALVLVAAGEIEAADGIVASPAPDDLGWELTFRWQFAQYAVALSKGDGAAARNIVRTLAERASRNGYQDIALMAQKVLANPTLPVMELIRMVLTSN